MKITVLTLFKEMYESYLNTSVISRIIKKGLIDIDVVDIRDYAYDTSRHVDDTPYGGGPGMLMKVDIVYDAIKNNSRNNSYILLTNPKAKPFKQEDAIRLSKMDDIVIVCGHYEGIDSRIEEFVDEKISIGDYILTGGELPSLVVIDTISRLLDEGINSLSLKEESFNDSLLEYPQFTRPAEFKGLKVPEVLMNGNHKEIRKYNIKNSILETMKYRPDLLDKHKFTEEEKEILKEIENERKS